MVWVVESFQGRRHGLLPGYDGMPSVQVDRKEERMGNPAVKDEILRRLDGLSGDQQNRVLDFVEHIGSSGSQGYPLQDLKPFAGMIDKTSAKEMQTAIDEACERVDADEW